MKHISKSENTRLFQEAENLRKNIQSELHYKARNSKTSESVSQASGSSRPVHNKSGKRT